MSITHTISKHQVQPGWIDSVGVDNSIDSLNRLASTYVEMGANPIRVPSLEQVVLDFQVRRHKMIWGTFSEGPAALLQTAQYAQYYTGAEFRALLPVVKDIKAPAYIPTIMRELMVGSDPVGDLEDAVQVYARSLIDNKADIVTKAIDTALSHFGIEHWVCTWVPLVAQFLQPHQLEHIENTFPGKARTRCTPMCNTARHYLYSKGLSPDRIVGRITSGVFAQDGDLPLYSLSDLLESSENSYLGTPNNPTPEEVDW